VLPTQAANNTSAKFEFEYRINADCRLTVTRHQFSLAVAKTPVEGPGGVEASFDFRAACDTTATRMMTVVLLSQQQASECA
jgi:hypothetical protein